MLDQQEIKHLLQWYVEMGVDETIAREPANWKARSKEVAAPSAAARQPAASTAVPSPDKTSPNAFSASLSAVVAQARALADKAITVSQLEQSVREFDGCQLKKMAKNTVFGDGNPQSKLLFIGEAPGADEDRQGIPFCGVSGQLLTDMLEAIQLRRESDYFITNTLFWRPPGNRNPTPDEQAICLPFLEKLIALTQPELLVLVGGMAVKSLLNEARNIAALRKQPLSYRNQYLDREIPVKILYHPSYLLRQPLQKRAAWHDLLAIERFATERNLVK